MLQTQLKKQLPIEFISEVAGDNNVALAYSLIPVIPTLDEPIRGQVEEAFAKSMAVMWQVCIGISGIGLIASLFMKGLPLHTEVDKRWGLHEKADGEAQIE